jgi:hypothetical protein
MNFPDDFSKPKLIEPGVKYFLNETLKQAHVFKMKYYNVVFNVGLFILFVVILGSILIYKYKGKMSEEEIRVKNVEKQQYILSKIKKLQEAKRIAHQELITGLPNWENEYDSIQ